MLLVVGHSGIGSALETLLRLEDRYEVRRVQSLGEAGGESDAWAPEVALVDGVLLSGGKEPRLAMPVLVLSGSQSDGKRLMSRLPDARGWLRKDATAGELRAEIDRILVDGSSGQAFGSPRSLMAGIVVLVVVAAVLAAALLRPGL